MKITQGTIYSSYPFHFEISVPDSLLKLRSLGCQVLPVYKDDQRKLDRLLMHEEN